MRLSILILSLAAMAIPKSTKAQSLDHYQWKNRILLLVDANPHTDALESQLDELTAHNDALKERDLIIFRVTPNSVYDSDGSRSEVQAQKIYDEFKWDSDFRGTVLIGKDGGSKLEEPFEVSAQVIFDRIDGMPMRRAEMRKSEQK